MVAFALVLFVVGLVAPRQSKRLQRGLGRQLRRGEDKGDRKAGRLGDWTETAIRWARKISERSAEGGRKLRRKLSRGSQGGS
ncbi:MAG: DUF6411 family protein [Actinomycetota bacterium]|nr:DUF6411 family protein [Actinomycetota bacterium]